MVNIYRFADHTVEVDSLYPLAHRACRAYRAEGQAEAAIRITEEDLRREREKSIQMFLQEGLPPEDSSDAYLEILAVLRKLAEAMVQKYDGPREQMASDIDMVLENLREIGALVE